VLEVLKNKSIFIFQKLALDLQRPQILLVQLTLRVQILEAFRRFNRSKLCLNSCNMFFPKALLFRLA
jgi:hypothetical protein